MKFLYSFVIFSFFSAYSQAFERTETLDISSFECKHKCSLLITGNVTAVTIKSSGKVLFDSKGIYHRFYPVLLQLNDIESNQLKITGYNQLTPDIKINYYISSYSNNLQRTLTYILKNNLLTLCSVFSLLVLLILWIALYIYYRSISALYISTYCLISMVYLVSFSEIPRMFFDPLFLSGQVHFSLRLLQDLALILLFGHFYKSGKNLKILYPIVFLYIFAIILIFYGVPENNFSSSLFLIKLFAPLVAFPMGIGVYFAFTNNLSSEKKIIVPISIVLFLFQVNDLLLFWGVIDTFYLVKIYVPLIIILVSYIFMKRKLDELELEKLKVEKTKIIKDIYHDIRSPLESIRSALVNYEIQDLDAKEMVFNSLDRISGLTKNILKNDLDIDIYNLQQNEDIILYNFFMAIIREKNLISEVEIKLDYRIDKNFKLYSDELMLYRSFNNFINNSIEAESRSIDIIVNCDKDNLLIEFKDDGVGMSDEMMTKIKLGNYTTKPSGNGIGFRFSYEALSRLGFSVEITSSFEVGTSILVKKEILSMKECYMKTIVYIDNDMLMLKSWEFAARRKDVKLFLFSSVDEFLENHSEIPKDSEIYIDSELDDGKLGEVEGIKIHDIGFEKLYLATGKDAEDVSLPDCFLGVVGKRAPF